MSTSPTLFDCVSDFIIITIFEYQSSDLFYMNKMYKVLEVNNRAQTSLIRILVLPRPSFVMKSMLSVYVEIPTKSGHR